MMPVLLQRNTGLQKQAASYAVSYAVSYAMSYALSQLRVCMDGHIFVGGMTLHD